MADSKFVVVYWRYGAKDEEEFDTLEEVVRFVDSQEDRGEIWTENVFFDGQPLYEKRGRSESFPRPRLPDQHYGP